MTYEYANVDIATQSIALITPNNNKSKKDVQTFHDESFLFGIICYMKL